MTLGGTTAAPPRRPAAPRTAYRLAATGLLLWAAAAAVSGMVRLTFGPRPVFVHVRWAPTIDPGEQRRVEARYHLSLGEQLEGRTWGYVLLDLSRDNIRALVGDAAVEDTHYIHRTAFRPWYSAPRRRYATSRFWIPESLGILSVLCTLIGAVSLGLAVVAVRDKTGTFSLAPLLRDNVFLLLLLAALLLRLYFAGTASYIHDEENASIPLSRTISFMPGDVQLPIRGQNHPALPAYFVKVSGMLFGTRPLGYRAVHVLASLSTILLIFFLARQWYGPPAARWAAALLAFNEYYVAVSSRATSHVPHLFFLTAAIYAFGRFLRTERATYLYAAGIAVGLAFYCKEHSALLLPVFLVTLLHSRYRRWFGSWHVYAACAMFFLLIAPDILWNLGTSETSGSATYDDHLQRVGGIGFSPYPFMFLARGAIQWAHIRATGRALIDDTPEYQSMNSAIGVLLLGAVLATTLRRRPVDGGHRFLLLLFWVIFGFFVLVRPGDPPKGLDPVSWIWVDVTMIPAVILAGARLASVHGKHRTFAWSFAGGALVYAGVRIVTIVT